MSKKKKKQKTGLPPGTLVYTGEKLVETPNVVLLSYDENNISEHKLTNGHNLPTSTSGVRWLDIRGVGNIKLIEAIGQTFHIHPLVLEDILNTSQRPKWEDYPNGIFLVAQAMRFDENNNNFISEQIAFFLSNDIVITFQEDEHDIFAPIRQRLHNGLGRIRQKGVDYLTYALLDSIVDEYFVILDRTEESIESLETKILADFKHSSRSEIYYLKRLNSDIRRAILPLRDVSNRFVREDSAFVHPTTTVFARDLNDHVVRVIEMVESQKDMLNNLDVLFNSEQANKATHVMKVLTIVSSIFIPLTFIVGVYGMNFKNLPELNYPQGYYWVWVVMIIIAVGQLWYFRKKKWL